jgi:GNAT superfamily N-acetyltransferase
VIDYAWRGSLESDDLERLHAEGFEREPVDYDWAGQLDRHSLGWVTARDGGRLVGFVNVAWDGATRAFILDTLVTRSHRRQGIGTELVAIATREARAAGCEWLHVDFEPHLTRFYLEECGFRSTPAGVIALQSG